MMDSKYTFFLLRVHRTLLGKQKKTDLLLLFIYCLSNSRLFATIDPEKIEKVEFTYVVKEPNAEYFYVGNDDNCTYVRTNFEAKNFRLVCVDLSNLASVSIDNYKLIN